MKKEVTIQVDWKNVTTKVPPIPTIERGEGHRAPQENSTNGSVINN